MAPLFSSKKFFVDGLSSIVDAPLINFLLRSIIVAKSTLSTRTNPYSLNTLTISFFLIMYSVIGVDIVDGLYTTILSSAIFSTDI
ncbi:putative D ORF A [Vaccinia virus Copenhagen]|uniref:Uncharacterized 9.2 kDa protein n=4 Tax=Vaccinia virus TaxID=10245 RepID=YVDA_VACCC|nr:RecName: Full=Uncharacterized 9.2 kDa protein [Vaccinia virus Copenhagen]AAW23517.1 hypothetical protein m8126L [Vaccinia virus]ABZ80038.1 hypothetical protein GL136 [synthetic Vaccinia virus]BBD06176.1 putative D ORF A [BAC cloning vector pLC16m8.8S-BAC]AAA48096.1 putative D ORF A [Vaccinia virus Copenhagen]AAW23799.1 hypothetical protein mO126L [Vaccinia virus]